MERECRSAESRRIPGRQPRVRRASDAGAQPGSSPPSQATSRERDSKEPISLRLPAPTFAIGYLCTGTALAVLGQVVTNQGAFDPSTQLVAWTKYACTFLLSLSLQLASRATGSQRSVPPLDKSSRGKAAWLTVAVGLLDTLSYGLNCLGFALCGSALSMVVFAACGQVFTAITRRLLLRKTMTTGQTLGIALVVVGLVIRSLNKLMEVAATHGSGRAAAGLGTGVAAGGAWTAVRGLLGGGGGGSSMASGVALVALSALGYSLLGCLYEWLSAVRGPTMSHAQVATVTSLVGLVATSAYQLAFTRPRWGPLVAQRMAERGLDWPPVVRLYALFGALFTVHGLVQGVVLQRSGATAVGVVSAMRAAAVAVASGLLFCSPASPHQCLTPHSAASAAVVTAGALVWTLTGPKKTWPPASTAAAHGETKDKDK